MVDVVVIVVVVVTACCGRHAILPGSSLRLWLLSCVFVKSAIATSLLVLSLVCLPLLLFLQAASLTHSVLRQDACDINPQTKNIS